MKNSWTGGEAALAVEGSAENLALAVHRCEPGAFERLIDRYEASLFSYAESVLQNRFDAQEVVQDALMRAHKALTRQYDEARCEALALRPWLFRTVRNLSLNKRRSKRSALDRPLEEFNDDRLGPYVSGVDSELARREDAELLHDVERLARAVKSLALPSPRSFRDIAPHDSLDRVDDVWVAFSRRGLRMITRGCNEDEFRVRYARRYGRALERAELPEPLRK